MSKANSGGAGIESTQRPTYIKVQQLGPENIVVDYLDIDELLQTLFLLQLSEMLEELGQLRSAYAVGAINLEGLFYRLLVQGPDEGLGKLLVVANLAHFTVRLGRAFCVCAANQVVELRSGEDLVVEMLGADRLERIGEGSNQLVARRTGVAAVDDLGRGGKVDLEVGGESLVCGCKVLVRSSVDQHGGVGLPVLLEHLTHGVHDLDTIVGGGVVAGRDHDTDGLAIELATPQGCEKPDAKGDTLEQVGLHTETCSAIGVLLALGEGHDRVLLRSSDNVLSDSHGESIGRSEAGG